MATKFYPATIGSLSVRVLLVEPDPASLKVTHRLDTTVAEGRTTIEERRPARDALLLTQTCTLPAIENDLDDFRQGLAALGPTLVAMPLWVDALPVADWSTRIYEPAQIINFTPGGADFAIYAAGSLPGSPAYSHYAPLLIGRLKEMPQASAIGQLSADLAVVLNEASPYDCRIGIQSYGSGWTAEPDWTTAPKEQLGYGLELITLDGVAAREPGLDRVNAAARWTQQAGFTFADRLEIRTALSWFVDRRGSCLSWSPVPAWLTPGVGTPATPLSYTARFSADILDLAFPSGALATATIGFTQEVDTGARSQSLAGEAYLYRFDYGAPGDLLDQELWTNWDAPLTASEGDFTPAQIAHDDIVASLKPQDRQAQVSMAFTAGSLCHDFMRARLFAPLTLAIWKCDPADPEGTREELITVRVTKVLPDGNTLKITADSNYLFAARLPGWTMGPRCNVQLFSPECGLSEATYLAAGTMSNASGDLSTDGMGANARSVTGGPAGPAYPVNYFANGIFRTGTGRQTQIVLIVSSAAASGGTVGLSFNRPLFADMISASGQAVELVPGCSGQYQSDCTTKFSNSANFRGTPFVPAYIASEASKPKTK